MCDTYVVYILLNGNVFLKCYPKVMQVTSRIQRVLAFIFSYPDIDSQKKALSCDPFARVNDTNRERP